AASAGGAPSASITVGSISSVAPPVVAHPANIRDASMSRVSAAECAAGVFMPPIVLTSGRTARGRMSRNPMGATLDSCSLARVSGNQLQGDIPQPVSVPGVERVGRNAAAVVGWTTGNPRRLLAVFEVAPAHALQERRCSQQNRCRRTLLHCLAPLHRRLHGARVLLKSRRDSSWVQRIGADAVG